MCHFLESFDPFCKVQSHHVHCLSRCQEKKQRFTWKLAPRGQIILKQNIYDRCHANICLTHVDVISFVYLLDVCLLESCPDMHVDPSKRWTLTTGPVELMDRSARNWCPEKVPEWDHRGAFLLLLDVAGRPLSWSCLTAIDSYQV